MKLSCFLSCCLILLTSVTAPAQTLPPATIQYQGRVSVSSTAHEGTGYFKFLLHAPDKRLWSNDDSHGGAEPTPDYEPAGSVTVVVSAGLFAADLGSGAMPAITPGVFFDGTGDVRSEVSLRVWFSATGGAGTFVKLSPDRKLSSVPFSLLAASVARGAITGDKIFTGAVGTAAIAPAAITTAKIALGAVTGTELAANSVDGTKLSDGSVANTELAANAVTSDKIADGNIQPQDLSISLQNAVAPPGAVMAYAANTAPQGWLLCDGRAVSRTTYAALYALIGTTHGAGDTTTTFNLPDYRGRFLRGVDDPDGAGGLAAAGRDPNAVGRTAMAAGGNTAGNVGSVQADEFKSHTHTVGDRQGGSFNTININVNGSNAILEGMISGAAGGSETRPKNAYVNYIIKY